MRFCQLGLQLGVLLLQAFGLCGQRGRLRVGRLQPLVPVLVPPQNLRRLVAELFPVSFPDHFSRGCPYGTALHPIPGTRQGACRLAHIRYGSCQIRCESRSLITSTRQTKARGCHFSSIAGDWSPLCKNTKNPRRVSLLRAVHYSLSGCVSTGGPLAP